jgi:hypothetical protein
MRNRTRASLIKERETRLSAVSEEEREAFKVLLKHKWVAWWGMDMIDEVGEKKDTVFLAAVFPARLIK